MTERTKVLKTITRTIPAVEEFVYEEEVIHQDKNGVTTTHSTAGNPGHVYNTYMSEAGAKLEEGVLACTHFQSGPVKEVGLNGITSEGLLAILIHRTEVMNDNFPCKENEEVISHLKAALEAFDSRTRDRIDRGVEGESKA